MPVKTATRRVLTRRSPIHSTVTSRPPKPASLTETPIRIGAARGAVTRTLKAEAVVPAITRKSASPSASVTMASSERLESFARPTSASSTAPFAIGLPSISR